MGIRDIMMPGRYDLPEDAYHADPVRHLGGSLSSSIARKLLAPSCPALARYAADHPEPKAAMDLGSVVHKLLLGSGPPIVEVPADSWRTAAAKAARDEARAAGKIPLLTADLRAAEVAAESVWRHETAAALLRMPGRSEQTLIWREPAGPGPVWCRAMLDRWPEPGPIPVIVDVKTTGKGLDDESLARTIWEYRYHQQEAWYRRGYAAVHGQPADFAFVFVSTAPPHLVRVIQLDDAFRADGEARNSAAIGVWAECVASGIWPGHGTEFDLIGPPRWARTWEEA